MDNRESLLVDNTKAEGYIDDFGQHIGGAKKELFKLRGFQISDLDSLNPKEYSKVATKDTVWVEPDYKKLVTEEGWSPECAYFYKMCRTCFPAKMEVDRHDETSKEAAIKFIELLQTAKAECEKLKNKSERAVIFDNIFKKHGYYNNGWTHKIRGTGFASRNLHELEKVINMRNDMETTVEIMDFPEIYRGDLKEIHVVYAGKSVSTGADVYELRIQRYKRATRNTFSSVAEAIKYAKEVYVPDLDEAKEKKKGTRVKIEERPQLAHIERKGPKIDRREHITTDDLQGKFQFRGGEFGNWNNQSDRQACIDFAFDSFYDLAKVLNIRLQDIAIEAYRQQKLAIAFGSRGAGRANAHYEPDRVVINLTKMKGAGSLAHEFGHAFDDACGYKCGTHGLLTKNITHISKDMNNKRLAEAFKSIVSAMKYKRTNQEEAIKVYEENVEKRRLKFERDMSNMRRWSTKGQTDEAVIKEIESKFDILLEEMRKCVVEHADDEDNSAIEAVFAKMDDLFFVYRGARMHSGNKDAVWWSIVFYGDEIKKLHGAQKGNSNLYPRVETQFYRDAQKLDSIRSKTTIYFACVEEMFARSFESCVEDKLGFVNSYLVHSTRRTISGFTDEPLHLYPMGEEREVIKREIMRAVDIYREDILGGVVFDGRYIDGVEDTRKDAKNVDTRTNKVVGKEETKKVEKKKVEKKKEEDRKVEDKKAEVKKAEVKKAEDKKAEVKKEEHKKAEVKKEEHKKEESNKCKVDLSKIETAKDLREILSKSKVIKSPINSKNISKYCMMVKNKGILYGPVPYRKRTGNSKAIGFNTNMIVVCSDGNVKFEKQLEGLLEATVRKVVRESYNNEDRLIQGATLCLCSQMGLNVRTYCQSEEYDKLVRNKKSLGDFLKCVSQISKIVKTELKIGIK